MSDYTLVVPTLNRPDLLARLLRYFDRLGARFPILVLDSSDPEEMAANDAAIRATSLDIAHLPFDRSLPVDVKLRRGVGAVSTTYLSFCADDDVVFPAAIAEAVAFLRAHADYAVAQGYYLGFRESPTAFTIESVIYATASIDHDSPLSRLYATVRHYQPVFYGVMATDTWHRAHDRIDAVEGFVFKEFLQACQTAILGKIARLPRLYSGRQVGNAFADWSNARNFTGHPVHWCLAEPRRFFASYERYRNALLEAVQAAAALTGPRADVERALDVLHLRYLIADPMLILQQEEALEGTPAAVQKPAASADDRPAVNGLIVKTALSGELQRQYHLLPAFVRALAPGPDGRRLLRRQDVLATIRTLDEYR